MKAKTPIIMAIIVLCLCALLLGILFAKEQGNGAPTMKTDQVSSQKLVKMIDKDTVTSLVLPIDGLEIKLVKSNDIWSIDGDRGTPISKVRIDALLEKIELILALREIGKRELADYGLDQPTRTVTLTASDGNTVISFGNMASGDVGYYFSLDGKTVYLAESSLYDAFSFEMTDIVELPKIKDYGEISSIAVNGSTVDDGELIGAIENITAESLVDYAAKDESIYGLGDRQTSISLSFLNGEEISFSLGRGERDDYIYLQVDGSDAIYLIVSDNNSILLQHMR